MENADRARFHGVLNKQIEQSKATYAKQGALKTMPNNFRAVQSPNMGKASAIMGPFILIGGIAFEALSMIDFSTDPINDMHKADVERAHKDALHGHPASKEKIAEDKKKDQLIENRKKQQELQEKKEKKREKQKEMKQHLDKAKEDGREHGHEPFDRGR
jgi:hypothetical protein